MKKLLLTAILAASFVACDKKAETPTDANTTEPTTAETPAETPTKTEEPTAATSTPKFSSPEVQKVADEYAAFVKEYIAAYKSGDATKIQALVAKQQEWGTKMSSAMTSMTPDDVKAWTDFTQQLGKEMSDAAMAK